MRKPPPLLVLAALWLTLALSPSPAWAQESLPPDPAIAQYVETVPTAGGATTSTGKQSKQRTLSDAGTPSTGGEFLTQFAWLGVVLAVVTVAAVAVTVARGARRRNLASASRVPPR